MYIIIVNGVLYEFFVSFLNNISVAGEFFVTKRFDIEYERFINVLRFEL